MVLNIRYNDRIQCLEGMEKDGFSSKILTFLWSWVTLVENIIVGRNKAKKKLQLRFVTMKINIRTESIPPDGGSMGEKSMKCTYSLCLR